MTAGHRNDVDATFAYISPTGQSRGISVIGPTVKAGPFYQYNSARKGILDGNSEGRVCSI